MPEVRKAQKSSRKHIINVVFFISSTLIVTALWPPDKLESWSEFLGTLLIVSSCYLILYLFLSHFRPEILEVIRKTLFIMLTILLFFGLTRIVISFANTETLFLIPFALIPVVICTFFDARLALFILLITLMLSGFSVSQPFEFVFINFVAGIVAIFSLTNIYRKAKILFSAFVVVVSYSVTHLAVYLMDGSALSDLSLSYYKVFLGNGILILLSYPVIFLFETKFYFLSDTTLLELTNVNSPLLRRFADEAPGSFQHSLQVANLAEEAARATGANPLLARAGSLYHDIGKIVNPGFFIENQDGVSNPHTGLDPVESASIIINHVNEGVLLARKYKLPVQIIDFIRTHHGISKAYFFYRKFLENNESSVENEKKFSYPGPKPFSKETAIVMMADAVEAASRTLVRFDEASVNELIERIFMINEHDEQLSEAPLTFRQISDIKAIFLKRILNIHHVRQAYPDRDLAMH